MPREKANHDTNRLKVCLLCFKKTKEMRKITENHKDIIEKYVIDRLNWNDFSLPQVLCGSCRIILGEYSKGNFSHELEVLDYSLMFNVPPITRSSPRCQ